MKPVPSRVAHSSFTSNSRLAQGFFLEGDFDLVAALGQVAGGGESSGEPVRGAGGERRAGHDDVLQIAFGLNEAPRDLAGGAGDRIFEVADEMQYPVVRSKELDGLTGASVAVVAVDGGALQRGCGHGGLGGLEIEWRANGEALAGDLPAVEEEDDLVPAGLPPAIGTVLEMEIRVLLVLVVSQRLRGAVVALAADEPFGLEPAQRPASINPARIAVSSGANETASSASAN